MEKKPVFYDHSKRRRRRLHGLLVTGVMFAVGVAGTLYIGSLFTPNIPNPGLLDDAYHTYDSANDPDLAISDQQKVENKISVYAYHVERDPNSFLSLQNHIHQIDVLIPERLRLTEEGVEEIDSDASYRTLEYLKTTQEAPDVYAHIVNYNTSYGGWNGELVYEFFTDQEKRSSLIGRLVSYISVRSLDGVSIDFEDLDEETRRLMPSFLDALRNELDRVYPQAEILVHLPYNTKEIEVPYQEIYNASGLSILMAYDQHRLGGEPGPVSGIDRFHTGLNSMISGVVADEIIVGLGSYGYDRGEETSRTITWQEIQSLSGNIISEVTYGTGSQNPTFKYLSGTEERTVWYLDREVTRKQVAFALSQGIKKYSVWRLGSEDPGIWDVLDGGIVGPQEDTVSGGKGIKYFGAGPLIKIVKKNDAYDVHKFAPHDENKLLLTFDDGPSEYTDEVLDILQEYNVPAVFFPVGHQIEQFPEEIVRMFNEGHLVGNHSHMHHRIQEIGKREFQRDILKVHRDIESLTYHTPFLFRPPEGAVNYDLNDLNETHNLETLGSLGYYILHYNIDPKDWMELTARQITLSILEQITYGSVILLHDGGGNRAETVKALPTIISLLREKGYEFVTLQELYDNQYDFEMAPIPKSRRFFAFVGNLWLHINDDVITFSKYFILVVVLYSLLHLSFILLLFLKKVLGSRNPINQNYKPEVSVIIPAYNEGRVIIKTVKNVLSSDYENFSVIVVDDGSTDTTLQSVQDAFASHPKVTILTKENGGKASALNLGIEHAAGEIIIIQDADTLFENDAIGYIVNRFKDPTIGGVSGYVKVGNTNNWLGRYQAIEYITAQGVDRNALDLVNCILVVPGAIGARRKSVLDELGNIKHDTLAEDCDLTVEVLRAGHRIVYEDRAIAWTEAPETIHGFVKQRFRRLFGMMQVWWKHSRAMFSFSHPWLGRFSMPQLFVSTFVNAIISPLLDLLGVFVFVTLLSQLIIGEVSLFSSSAGVVVVYFLVYLLLQWIIAAIAFYLDKKNKRWRVLLVPFQKILYRLLYYWIGLKGLYGALAGRAPGRNKLQRTGTVDEARVE